MFGTMIGWVLSAQVTKSREMAVGEGDGEGVADGMGSGIEVWVGVGLSCKGTGVTVGIKVGTSWVGGRMVAVACGGKGVLLGFTSQAATSITRSAQAHNPGKVFIIILYNHIPPG